MASTPVSEASDGPVLSLINKRIRALKKKLTRIHQMEEAISQGKSINKEQQEVLKSKSSVVVIIDELEKLRLPLSSAVAEEISLAVNRQPQSDDVKPEPVVDEKVGAMEDLLNLVYFASLFDVKTQSDFTDTVLTRTHERACCLTYDTVTDDATDLLGDRDLDLIAKLGGLLISRPGDTNLSHQNALQRCREHAGLWLTNSEQPIEPNGEATYAGLREKLRKIMASGYFTTTPQMKPPVEMAKAYVPMSVPDQVEEQYQNKEEASSVFKDEETGDSQPSPAEEIQKTQNREETVSVQTEEEVVGHNQGEEREEQYNSRRSYHNNQRGGVRGGGGPRRGYNNSRGGGRGNGRGGGGGGYQNGRNYDQSGNYYPRNYSNNRGGGSRGGGGYNNHGGYSQADGGASS